MAGFGLTARMNSCRALPARCRGRAGRQRFGLLKIDAGSFGDRPATIFVTMRRQTIAPRQKRQINAMAKIKTLVLLGNDPQDLRSASYGHLNNTPAVNQ